MICPFVIDENGDLLGSFNAEWRSAVRVLCALGNPNGAGDQ